MKKAVVICLIGLLATQVFALSRKSFSFVDEQNKIKTDITSITVLDAGTSTSSMIYVDTAGTLEITNPITSSSTRSTLLAAGGNIFFYSEADTHDLQVTAGSATMIFYAVGISDRVLTVPRVASTRTLITGDITKSAWVCTSGDDTTGIGSYISPYKTIDHALSVATATRNTILIMPGEYTDVVSQLPDISGISIKAPFGGVVVSGVAGYDAAFIINPTYTASTFEVSFENIEVEVAASAYGISVNNANMTKKLNVYLKNCTFSGEAADSAITVAHSTATEAIRVYVDGNGEVWEGIVNFVCANTGDRLRIKNQILLGGITTTGDVAGEIFLENTGILTSGITIDNDHKLSTIGCWYQTDADPTVYTNCANAFATY